MKWLAFQSRIFLGPKLASCQDLQGFLESRAAYLAQKSISEYTQARANMMFSTLLGEKAFQDAYERVRWFSFATSLRWWRKRLRRDSATSISAIRIQSM